MNRTVTIAAGALVIILVGCGSTPPAVSPAAVAPTSAPVISAPAVSDDERAVEVRQLVDMLYCGGDPRAAWCKVLHRVEGVPDVVIDGATLVLVTTAANTKANRKLGAQACKDLTTMTRTTGRAGLWDRIRIQSKKRGVDIGTCDLA